MGREGSDTHNCTIVLDGKACEPMINILNLFPPKRKADSNQQFWDYSLPKTFSLTLNYWKTLKLAIQNDRIFKHLRQWGTDFGGI